MLDPTTIQRGSTIETQPYHHRTANEMDIGGGTKYRNDVLLDGTPLTAGNKLGYTPPMDSVSEYTIQQNAVDAEFGHSAGGIAIVTMKSGTNDVKGSAYYFGRDASLNAMSDRATQKHNDNPYWNAGGDDRPADQEEQALPVRRLRRDREHAVLGRATTRCRPRWSARATSRSPTTPNGTLRVIYDPLTSRTVNGVQVRDPFPGNVIPANRWDPVAAQILGGLWQPNNAGDDATGFNNFKAQDERTFHYLNFSTRLDWNINDRWKAYARVSRMKTDQDANDYTDGNDPLKLRNTTGSKRNGWNIAADTVYTFNPSTTLNVRGSFYQVEDKREYPDMVVGEEGYANLWPSGWWQPYAEGRPLIYSPYIVVESTARNQFGVANYWYQQPKGYSVHARLNKYLHQHSLKAGTEIRWKRGDAARFFFTDLRFTQAATANRWTSPTTTTGNPWASFLLGAMDPGSSNVQYRQLQIANTEFYGFYVQDDWKVTQKITLNLGLRYEYQGGLWDPQYRLPQRLDLTDPIPGMAEAIDPKIPADVRAIMAQSAGATGYTYNGAFYFTEEGNKRKTNAWTRRVHAPHRPRVAARREDRLPGRLRALRHPHRARQLGARHPGRDRPRRLQPDHERPRERQRRPGGLPRQPVPAGPDARLRQELRPQHQPGRQRLVGRVRAAHAGQRPHQRLAAARDPVPDRGRRHLLRQLHQPRPVQPEPQPDRTRGCATPTARPSTSRSRTRSTTTGRWRSSPARCAASATVAEQPAAAALPAVPATSSRPAPTCARRSTSRSSSACRGRSPTASRSWRPTPTSSRARSGSTTSRTSTTAT